MVGAGSVSKFEVYKRRFEVSAAMLHFPSCGLAALGAQPIINDSMFLE